MQKGWTRSRGGVRIRARTWFSLSPGYYRARYQPAGIAKDGCQGGHAGRRTMSLVLIDNFVLAP